MVKLTLPVFTVPSVLVTVAFSGTFCALALYEILALEAAMVSTAAVECTKKLLPVLVPPLLPSGVEISELLTTVDPVPATAPLAV
jgi:hypothetical protein